MIQFKFLGIVLIYLILFYITGWYIVTMNFDDINNGELKKTLINFGNIFPGIILMFFGILTLISSKIKEIEFHLIIFSGLIFLYNSMSAFIIGTVLLISGLIFLFQLQTNRS